MAKRFPISIMAINIYRRLCEQHEVTGDRACFELPSWRMRIVGRHCTVAGKRSGGYVVSGVLTDHYEHSPGIQTLNHRLCHKNTTKTRQWAIHEMFGRMIDLRRLCDDREDIYNLFKEKAA